MAEISPAEEKEHDREHVFLKVLFSEKICLLHGVSNSGHKPPQDRRVNSLVPDKNKAGVGNESVSLAPLVEITRKAKLRHQHKETTLLRSYNKNKIDFLRNQRLSKIQSSARVHTLI